MTGCRFLHFFQGPGHSERVARFAQVRQPCHLLLFHLRADPQNRNRARCLLCMIRDADQTLRPRSSCR